MSVNSCTEYMQKTKAGEVKAYRLNVICRRKVSDGGITQTKAESYFVRSDEAIAEGKVLELDLRNWNVRTSTVTNDDGTTATFKWLVFKSAEEHSVEQVAPAQTVVADTAKVA